jgi:hypothetical protein
MPRTPRPRRLEEMIAFDLCIPQITDFTVHFAAFLRRGIGYAATSRLAMEQVDRRKARLTILSVFAVFSLTKFARHLEY